jgi:hypothetical protein
MKRIGRTQSIQGDTRYFNTEGVVLFGSNNRKSVQQFDGSHNSIIQGKSVCIDRYVGVIYGPSRPSDICVLRVMCGLVSRRVSDPSA